MTQNDNVQASQQPIKADAATSSGPLTGTGGAAGRLVVVPASSVRYRSWSPAAVRERCCTSVLYGVPRRQLGWQLFGSVQAGEITAA